MICDRFTPPLVVRPKTSQTLPFRPQPLYFKNHIATRYDDRLFPGSPPGTPPRIHRWRKLPAQCLSLLKFLVLQGHLLRRNLLPPRSRSGRRASPPQYVESANDSSKTNPQRFPVTALTYVYLCSTMLSFARSPFPPQ